MKIAVVGLGYVGLVTLAVLASTGHEIVGIDNDIEKLNQLKAGNSPIFESGLSEILRQNDNRIKYTDSYEDVGGSVYTFLSLPTPTKDNRIDIHFVIEAGKKVHENDRDTNIVMKSTVIPGTARKLGKIIGKDVISNPEFLREGSAIKDTMHPDRIIVGGKTNAQEFSELWKFCNAPIILTTNENAELIKYASNAFLATKISFINQVADLCEQISGADVNVVAEGMGLDHRIGREFLKAGLGYGGSCFPKDTKALVSFADDQEVDLSIVKSAINSNETRVDRLVNNFKVLIKERKSSIAVLGLSFKDNTDDIRESKSLELIRKLQEYGYNNIIAYDPVVLKCDGIKVINDLNSAIENSDFIIVATEWPVFSKALMGFDQKHIIDLRRIIDKDLVKLEYGVGLNVKN
jgi:UDPglucose 6-dehydrogenase